MNYETIEQGTACLKGRFTKVESTIKRTTVESTKALKATLTSMFRHGFAIKREASNGKKEKLTEYVKHRTAIFRLAWATLIAAGAGIIGLILKDIDLRVAAGAGAVVMIVGGVMVGHLHRSIRVRRESLEEM